MKKLITILSLIITTNSFAQDSIEPINLQEVQVLGINVKRSDPVTTTLIDLDSLNTNYQGDDPFFIIRNQVPNILTQSDNGTPYGYSYIRMRGMDQTRINFTLNGLPLNEMEDQGIYFSNMPDFLSNIDEIQVQRGIGTSKWGTTSFAGSVNMTTRSPLKKQIRADIGYGSFNTQRFSVGYSSGLSDSKFAFSTNLSTLRTDGFRNNSGSKGNTIFNEIGYYGEKNTVKIWGFSGRSENQMSWLAPNDSLIKEDYRTNLNSPDEIDDFNQNLVSLNWINYSIDNLNINSSIYFNNINGFYTAYLDETTLGRFKLNSYQAGGMSNINYSKKNTTLNGGVNYNWYQRRHTLADNNTPDDLWYQNWGYKQDFITYFRWNERFHKFNIFLDFQYRHVSFNYDGLKNWNWNFFNPKIGVKYTDRFYSMYISMGSTQREATRSDLLRGYDDVEYLGGNQFQAFSDTFNVNPLSERCWNAEIGGHLESNGFRVDVNGYFMFFNNERIGTGEINYIGLSLRNPVERSYRLGIETDLSYRWKGLSIGTNISYSYNRIDSYISADNVEYNNVEPFASPNLIMNNYIGFVHKRFLINLNGNYVSRSFLDNTQNYNLITPSYYILNGSIGYRQNNVYVILTMNNITDQKYYLPAGVSENRPTYYVGALRNFFVTLRIRI